MPANITFRTQLLGGVAEFCNNIDLSIFRETLNLVELIVLLARYREEGVRLYPKVYLTNDIENLSLMLPEGERIKISVSTPDAAGIKKALKRCAPLATGGWLIYIQSGLDMIEYGIFKGPSTPIAVLVDDVIMKPNERLVVVKAFQVADECVEIKANNGSFHYIFLNHWKEDSPPPLQYLDKLVSAITEKTKEKNREPVVSFLTRLLFEALRQSHGCIVAVTSMRKPPKLLSGDGVILDEPIDFAQLVTDLRKNRIASSVIDSKGHLLSGMLNSDGIVLFDNRGRLLGYNCFITMNQKNNKIGGARKRAFATLVGKLGKGVCAAFMQSQDGWSEFKGNV